MKSIVILISGRGSNMEAIVGHTLLRGYPDRDVSDVTNVFLADAGGGAVGANAGPALLELAEVLQAVLRDGPR